MVILLTKVVVIVGEVIHEGFSLKPVTHGLYSASLFLQGVLECFQGQHPCLWQVKHLFFFMCSIPS